MDKLSSHITSAIPVMTIKIMMCSKESSEYLHCDWYGATTSKIARKMNKSFQETKDILEDAYSKDLVVKSSRAFGSSGYKWLPKGWIEELQELA